MYLFIENERKKLYRRRNARSLCSMGDRERFNKGTRLPMAVVVSQIINTRIRNAKTFVVIILEEQRTL
jgi:hypothetical protein